MLLYLQIIESDEDKSKFEQIYLYYSKLMFWAANRILENKSDAEDAVHQAFVSIIENLNKISQIECPKTKAFVVIVVENKAKDILRSRKHIADNEFDEAAYGMEIELPDGNELAGALSRLPVQYRNVILLRHAYGYRPKEIGKILGCSQDSVYKLLQRSKEALRKELEADGVMI